ncbi:phage holin family protein [Streptococcus uberis]|nr:phage holin family protein [Streptococcus uberis]
MEINLITLLHLFKGLTTTLEIHIFTIFVCLDIITGLVKGITNKKANSTKGLTGIIKHFLVVLLVYLVYPYLILMGVKPVGFAFVLFFIAVYGISILENWGQIGLPMPAFVKMFFEKLMRDTDTYNIAKIRIDNSGVEIQTSDKTLGQKQEK